MARSWMGRPRRQSPLPSPTTDFFSALFRLAFIFAFLGALWFLGFTWMQSWVVQVIVVLATCFTTVVLALFARDQDVRWQRVPSLIIDLALISAALFTASFQAPASLFQMYYLVILEAAIWFQLRGALLAATAASVAYGVVQLSLAQSYVDLEALAMQAAGVVPFLLIVALVAGYMEASQQQARRLREQMRLARTLQDLMLPPSPPQPLGWQVALRLEPAGEVGGDLYLVESLGPERYVLGLGDICGKSVYGLIYLSLILWHIQASAREGLTPRQIAAQVNRRVFETMAPETYAALFVAQLDPNSGELSFVNCGHVPPLLASARQQTVRSLGVGGIVIGAQQEAQYEEYQVRLEPGDMLIAFTDGLNGARNRAGEEWGEARVAEAARQALQAGADAEEMVERLISRARQWAARPRADDATCLVLRRAPEPAAGSDQGAHDADHLAQDL